MICATFSSPASFFNQARATLQPKERDETRIRKIIGKDNPRVASGSRRRSREEKGAESAVSGFARVADTKDEERERSPPITRRSFNYAAPVDRARTVRRR